MPQRLALVLALALCTTLLLPAESADAQARSRIGRAVQRVWQRVTGQHHARAALESREGYEHALSAGRRVQHADHLEASGDAAGATRQDGLARRDLRASARRHDRAARAYRRTERSLFSRRVVRGAAHDRARAAQWDAAMARLDAGDFDRAADDLDALASEYALAADEHLMVAYRGSDEVRQQELVRATLAIHAEIDAREHELEARDQQIVNLARGSTREQRRLPNARARHLTSRARLAELERNLSALEAQLSAPPSASDTTDYVDETRRALPRARARGNVREARELIQRSEERDVTPETAAQLLRRAGERYRQSAAFFAEAGDAISADWATRNAEQSELASAEMREIETIEPDEYEPHPDSRPTRELGTWRVDRRSSADPQATESNDWTER